GRVRLQADPPAGLPALVATGHHRASSWGPGGAMTESVTQAAGASSLDERFGQLYRELQHIARRELGASKRTSLPTTALVHEAYLRMEAGAVRDMGRLPFLALAGRVMRCVLVDHARERLAQKRGGNQVRVTLETEPGVAAAGLPQLDVLAIERGILALAE